MPNLRFQGGGEAALVAFDGRALRITSTRSFAPGERVEATLETPSMSIRGKVSNIKKQDDGTFDVTLLLFSLTREQRLALEERPKP